MKGWFFLVFSSCIGVFVRSFTVTKEKKHVFANVERVFSAFKKAVMFYEQSGNDLNLDAYFGLRIAQGNLIALTRHETNTRFVHESGIYRQLSQLENLVSRIGSKSLTTLQRLNPGYFSLVGTTVTKPWKTEQRFRRIKPNLVTTLSKRILHNDILYKYKPCLAKLLGSSGYGSKPCNVTEECWEVMMRPGEIGYVLTHQALYFMFGEQKGCFSKEYSSSLESVYDKICSNIYNQLLMMERIRPIKRIDADLMMEQSVVCGLLGYYEFLSPKRMKNLIKWQRASGCYGDIEEEENSNGYHSKPTMRKLLMEKELSDGCESHITGVGTALLSIYLRYLIENNTLLWNGLG